MNRLIIGETSRGGFMDSKELHEKILYPVVRVRAGGAGGSGGDDYVWDLVEGFPWQWR